MNVQKSNLAFDVHLGPKELIIPMHIKSEPLILYFETPVVLISTVNEDETYNLAPISSAFWLGGAAFLVCLLSQKLHRI